MKYSGTVLSNRAQLAHSVKDANGRPITEPLFEERMQMMQSWADYLDDLAGEHSKMEKDDDQLACGKA